MNTQKSLMEAKTLSDTLQQRGSTYGDFAEIAELSKKFRGVCADYLDSKGKSLSPVHQEALIMIFHKIARALAGDPNYTDNWHDVAGYATLVENHIRRTHAEAQQLRAEKIQTVINGTTERAELAQRSDGDGQAWGPQSPHSAAMQFDQREAVLNDGIKVRTELDRGPAYTGPVPFVGLTKKP